MMSFKASIVVGALILNGVLFGQTQSINHCTWLYRALAQEPISSSLKNYYLDGKPAGWLNELKNSRHLGWLEGNGGGVHRYELSNGKKVVAKTFQLGEKGQEKTLGIIGQIEEWEKLGAGAQLFGGGISYNKETKKDELTLVMEDIESPMNSFGKTIAVGKGRELEVLRKYSRDLREWVRDRLLLLLDRHPDPHPNNIFVRVTELKSPDQTPPEGSFFREGNLAVQVLLIDPTVGKPMGNHPMRTGNPDYVPEALLQYNRIWQENFFDTQLGLKVEKP
jgi:hypothetical protein